MADPAYLLRAVKALPAPSMVGGASGYFSQPQAELDPALFDGDHLKPAVRDGLLYTLGQHLSAQYVIEAHWAHVWLAGSGVTYQWAADRGNGDLDVLFSIDVASFETVNPQFRGWSEVDVAAEVNAELKARLWPQTAHSVIGGKSFEVTFYWNPGTGSDIRNIHPYAAYDLVNDRWDVWPPQLPADPRTLYPETWYQQADADSRIANGWVQESADYAEQLQRLPSSSPAWHAAGSHLNHITSMARALFDDIHLGRHAAFTDQGRGYGDYANFRWQRGKQNGTVQALRAIAAVGDEARRLEEMDKYGAPIDPADVAARRAALWRSLR